MCNAFRRCKWLYHYDLAVKVNGADGGTVTTIPPVETYYHGTTVMATAVPKSGYTFEGWYLNGEYQNELS